MAYSPLITPGDLLSTADFSANAKVLFTQANNTSSFANGAFTQANNAASFANSAFGRASLLSNTTGSYNTAIGRDALYSNTTASNNTAVGYQAGYSNTTGNDSTFIGFKAGYNSNQSGSGNTLTINTPQDVRTSASPTFSSLTLSTALALTNGGTGATSAAQALTETAVESQ